MAVTVQSTYLTDYARGFPGMLADGTTQNRISRTVEDAAGIAFGKACFQGTGDHGITATPGTKFMGILIADQGTITGVNGTPDVIGQYGTCSLLDMGNIFVLAGSATTVEAPAYVTSAGAFTTVSAGNTAIPAVFRETVASGAPVRLRVIEQ